EGGFCTAPPTPPLLRRTTTTSSPSLTSASLKSPSPPPSAAASFNRLRMGSEGCWRSLPKSAGLLRCGKSCCLRPDLKRGSFTEEEDELIIRRKLLSRGIDPTTHRPINHNPAIINHNISFSGTASSKEEDRKYMSGCGGGGYGGLIVGKEEKMISSPVNTIIKERCPDLNLELRISPPTYQEPILLMMKSQSHEDIISPVSIVFDLDNFFLQLIVLN
ncbi:hypothetical protein MIMGU_mgv11b015722mg, partial [Erythranthe guttata]